MKKQKRFTFKYSPIKESEEPYFSIDRKYYKETNNPTPYQNLPNGWYGIRGNKKDHFSYYCHYQNVWYLISEYDFDNGRYLCNAVEYNLLPCKKHSEWLELRKHRDKLTKHWKRMLFGYFHFLNLQALRRDTHLTFLKMDKKNEISKNSSS